MITLSNTGGIAMTNCFLIADERAGQAVLFDAPDHTVAPLLDETSRRGWTLIGLWLTHGHFDHFADHALVKQRFPGARILIHKLDEPKVRNPAAQTRMFQLPFEIPPLTVDANVADNERLNLGSLEVQVLHTPGHAPGHLCYYFPQEEVLIGGDLIIGGSIGRTDLPDSNHAQLEQSVRRVMRLPDTTKLLGGHGLETTLAQERKTNLFVREILEANS
jgi:glyoxylase-like metal-dependent hydrolase (beta-lactamase superfamily II)